MDRGGILCNGRIPGVHPLHNPKHPGGIALIVYIAGPYSPINGLTINENVNNAKELAKECWKNDIPAICPQMNTAFMDAVTSPDVFYIGDLDIIERCDAVLMVPGWEKSFGAKMERLHALREEIPVFESVKGLVAYRDNLRYGDLDD